MKTMTIKEAAKRLSIEEAEVKKMCKQGYLDTKEIPGTLPGITEKSVCEFLGEEYAEEVEKPKKRGRQPKVLCYGAAAEMLDRELDEVIQLAFDDVLEEWELPDSEEMGVTKRSVQAFMKDSPGEEEEKDEPVHFSIEEALDTIDFKDTKEIVDHEDVTDIHVGETKELMEPVEEIDEPVQDIIEYDEKALAEFKKQEVLKNTAAEDTVTMSRADFEAHVSIASMRAELGVYRSLKIFERRD